MTRTIYIAPDGEEFYYLPKLYKNVSPITKKNYEALGWTTRIEELPDIEVDNDSNLEIKEKAFVAELLKYANDLGLSLSDMDDINITNLKSAALSAGATEEQLALMSASLTTAIIDIMAETEYPWSIAWPRLKNKIPEYINELMGE